MNIELEEVGGRKFSDETVHLDGMQFTDCTFTNCDLVYSGGLPFVLSNSPLTNSNLQFAGSAMNTMQTLSAMHRFGMHEMVEEMFNRVRNPFQDSVQ